jgi:hypothetical protein
MKIFIRGNGSSFTRKQLLAFVAKGLRGPWYSAFRAQGEVVRCHILRAMDARGRHVEYYGLVEVAPSRIGWQIISRLNGAAMQDQTMEVRRWFDRRPTRDRRDVGEMSKFPAARNRRVGEERRRLVRVQKLDDLPQAVQSLSGARRGAA